MILIMYIFLGIFYIEALQVYMTPLHWAVKRGYNKIVELLL